MTTAISAVSLSHTFHTRRGPVDALRGLTLAVERGTFFGLFDPNGAGKSTLIHILATLTLPTGGQAPVMGFDVVRDDGQVRACIGLASANENSFYGWLTRGRISNSSPHFRISHPTGPGAAPANFWRCSASGGPTALHRL